MARVIWRLFVHTLHIVEPKECCPKWGDEPLKALLLDIVPYGTEKYEWHLCAQVLSWLEFQLEANPWLFLFWNWGFLDQNQEHLWIFRWQFNATFLDGSEVCCFKIRRNSSQLSTWTHKCFCAFKFNYEKLVGASHF